MGGGVCWRRWGRGGRRRAARDPVPNPPSPLSQAVAALAADPPLPHEDEVHLATIKVAKYGDPGAAKAEQTDFMVHAAGVARAPITAASPFVKTAGTKFTVGGAPVVFAGTNAFYLLLDSTSDADVLKFFDTVAAKGATLVRFFAFTNGYGEGSVPMRTPLQPRVGVFDESQWKRMDLILATAAQKGIRLIGEGRCGREGGGGRARKAKRARPHTHTLSPPPSPPGQL